MQAHTLADVVLPADSSTTDHNNKQLQDPHDLPQPGHTIRSDLLIAGTKIFTDTTWKKTNDSGGQDMTCIGVFLQSADSGKEFNLMMQATNTKAQSTLQAEAKAFLFASYVALSLQLHRPTFLTDNLIFAKAATSRRLACDHLNWEIRSTMMDFYFQSSPMESAIFRESPF
jgi:hypothetical protein